MNVDMSKLQKRQEHLKGILRKHQIEHCVCGHEIGFGDIAWNIRGMSEFGTEHDTIIVQCLACDREIAYAVIWETFSGLSNVDEVMRELETYLNVYGVRRTGDE